MAHALPISVVIRAAQGDEFVYNSENVSKVVLTDDGGANLVLANGDVVEVPADVFSQLRFDSADRPENHFSGIADIIGDPNAPIEIYDINGRFVGHDLKAVAPGVYIINSGDTTQKVLVQ